MARDVASLLAEMRNNPSGVRFDDACKVVTYYFGEPTQNATSHKVWKMPWAMDPRVNMQRGSGGKAKGYQVSQALKAIDLLMTMRAAAHVEQQQPVAAPGSKKKRTDRKRPKKRRQS